MKEEPSCWLEGHVVIFVPLLISLKVKKKSYNFNFRFEFYTEYSCEHDNELPKHVVFCTSYTDNCLAVCTLQWSQFKQPVIMIELFGIFCYPKRKEEGHWLKCYTILRHYGMLVWPHLHMPSSRYSVRTTGSNKLYLACEFVGVY